MSDNFQKRKDYIREALELIGCGKQLCNCKHANREDCQGPKGAGCSAAQIIAARKIAKALVERDELMWGDNEH